MMDIDIGDSACDLKPSAQQFLDSIKTLIRNASYDDVGRIFTDTNQKEHIHAYLQDIYEDLLRDVCLKNLDARTYEENSALYNCADEILKQLALHVPSDDLLIELLELIEERQQDYQFTTLLRALQTLLLNYGNDKSKAYDWSFNGVRSCLEQLKLPVQLSKGYDEEQAQLLEQDTLVEDLLARYITIGLFYGPLKEDVLQQPREQTIFKDCSLKSRRNVLCCFLVQLLGKPLALLDLTVTDERKTNSYTLQVVRSLTQDLTKLIINPYYFLTFVEQRERWKRRLDSSKGVFEMSCKNIFLTTERLPLEGLAIYYYMLFVDPFMQNDLYAAPKVYAPHFIVESCLYLVNKLLTQEEPPLQLYGLLLAQQVITIFMVQRRISSTALELDVHKTFCERLCTIVGYSAYTQLHRQSALLLKNYILLFDDEGRYLVISNLMPTLSHKGLKSYLSTIYKDIVAEKLNTTPATQKLPAEYSGKFFKELLLNVICQLPKGAETDLLDHADQISAALNIIRFFALSDVHNRTGFWNFKREIQTQFFEPLHKGLDYSIAHYNLEVKQVETNWDSERVQKEHQRALEILSVNISNNNNDEDVLQPESLNKERKLSFLRENLMKFDLLKSLWARTVELMEQASKKRNTIYGCAPVSRTLHSSQRLLHTATTTTTNATITTQQFLQKLSQKPQHCNRSNPKRFYARDATGSTTTGSGTSTTIDEFRQREEERERQYEEQQAQEETQSKSDDAESEAKQAKVEAVRIKILEAALSHVPTHGWTRTAIVQGAEEAGFPSVVHGMFPEGGFAIVSYFNGKCNETLVQHLQEETQNGKIEIRDPVDFLVRAVRMRLEMIEPYKKQWPQALALIALPQNASTALAQVLTLVDDICYFSGDRSVNFDWYTRRIGLATIFKMTEIYMLQDSSANHAKTWDFLQNRMDEAVQLQMMLMQTGDMTHRFQRSFNSAFVTARNILGLDYNRR